MRAIRSRLRLIAHSFRAALGGLALALFATSVEATCPQWDVSGQWNIEQENPTLRVELDLIQRSTEFTGTAKFNGAAGKAKGTIVGADFKLEIEVGGAKHVFRGEVGPARIAGVSSAPGAPRPTIWYSTREMKCVDAAPSAESAAENSSASASSATATDEKQNRRGAGKIWANPQVTTVPAGQVEGKTTLTWDAGAKHLNAEVWLKIDDEDEKLLVKQAKGSREERLKPNKVYFYMLKDRGEQLDSLTVIAAD